MLPENRKSFWMKDNLKLHIQMQTLSEIVGFFFGHCYALSTNERMSERTKYWKLMRPKFNNYRTVQKLFYYTCTVRICRVLGSFFFCYTGCNLCNVIKDKKMIIQLNNVWKDKKIKNKLYDQVSISTTTNYL